MPPTGHPCQVVRGRWTWCRDPVRERGALTSPLPGCEGLWGPLPTGRPWGQTPAPAHTPGTSTAPGHPDSGTSSLGTVYKASWDFCPAPQPLPGQSPVGARVELSGVEGGWVHWGQEGRTGPSEVEEKRQHGSHSSRWSSKVASRELRRRWGPGSVLEAEGTKCFQQVVPVSVWGPRRPRPGASSGRVSAGDRKGQEGTEEDRSPRKKPVPGDRKLVRGCLEQGVATSSLCRTVSSKCFKELVGTDFTPNPPRAAGPSSVRPQGSEGPGDVGPHPGAQCWGCTCGSQPPALGSAAETGAH